MSTMIKQRLVGAMVLVALSVIFLPMIFTGKETPAKRFKSQIPPKPIGFEDVVMSKAVSSSPAEEENAVREVKDSTAPEERMNEEANINTEQKLNASDESQTSSSIPVTSGSNNLSSVPSPPSKPEISLKKEAKTPPNSWVLQVATFSERSNATKLVNKLKSSGFKAFLSTQQDHKQYYYIVFVGPHLKKSVIESWRVKIDKKSGSKSLLMKFNPATH